MIWSFVLSLKINKPMLSNPFEVSFLNKLDDFVLLVSSWMPEMMFRCIVRYRDRVMKNIMSENN